MVRSSYIIILPGMGDDVPILGAVVTLYGAPLLHLFTLPPKSKTPIKAEIIVVFTSHFRRTKNYSCQQRSFILIIAMGS